MTLLIGGNYAGKTTILRAIDLACLGELLIESGSCRTGWSDGPQAGAGRCVRPRGGETVVEHGAVARARATGWLSRWAGELGTTSARADCAMVWAASTVRPRAQFDPTQ